MANIKFTKLIRQPSKRESLPSQFEQDVAEEYVCKREIVRTSTTFSSAAKHILILISIVFVISIILYKSAILCDLFSYFPFDIETKQKENPYSFFFLFFLFMLAVSTIVFMKRFLIGLIKLYQHYAAEDVRRRCLFKPTCSEFTILALKKYGVIIGLYKSYIRIFKKCRGNIYRIDYP
jgi:putative component of membrane protein insertase Oxa1/YidC/SpoIIIJ protein YidD